MKNEARISGMIGKFEFHHNVREKKIFSAKLESKRKSKYPDVIVVYATEEIAEAASEGWAIITGQIRSHNDEDGHTSVYLYATEIEMQDTERYAVEEDNYVELECELLKGRLKETKDGTKIFECIAKYTRSYRKSDYIPCIFWANDALYANSFYELNKNHGETLAIEGRLQSRVIHSPNPAMNGRMVHEISVSNIMDSEFTE